MGGSACRFCDRRGADGDRNSALVDNDDDGDDARDGVVAAVAAVKGDVKLRESDCSLFRLDADSE